MPKPMGAIMGCSAPAFEPVLLQSPASAPPAVVDYTAQDAFYNMFRLSGTDRDASVTWANGLLSGSNLDRANSVSATVAMYPCGYSSGAMYPCGYSSRAMYQPSNQAVTIRCVLGQILDSVLRPFSADPLEMDGDALFASDSDALPTQDPIARMLINFAEHLVEEFIGHSRFQVGIFLVDRDVVDSHAVRKALQMVSMYPISFVCIGFGGIPRDFRDLQEVEHGVNNFPRWVSNFQFVHVNELDGLAPARQAYYALLECPRVFVCYKLLLGYQEETASFKPPNFDMFTITVSPKKSSKGKKYRRLEI